MILFPRAAARRKACSSSQTHPARRPDRPPLPARDFRLHPCPARGGSPVRGLPPVAAHARTHGPTVAARRECVDGTHRARNVRRVRRSRPGHRTARGIVNRDVHGSVRRFASRLRQWEAGDSPSGAECAGERLPEIRFATVAASGKWWEGSRKRYWKPSRARSGVRNPCGIGTPDWLLRNRKARGASVGTRISARFFRMLHGRRLYAQRIALRRCFDPKSGRGHRVETRLARVGALFANRVMFGVFQTRFVTLFADRTTHR